MTNVLTRTLSRRGEKAHTVKCWILGALSFAFLALYVGALLGWVKPTPDDKMISRLEPIMFAVIGYLFASLPAERAEKTLSHEIDRQSQKAEAAQHAKEQVQQVREALEEKLKNAKLALVALSLPAGKLAAGDLERSTGAARDSAFREVVAVALGILSS